jgi:hypothetical protein
MNHPKAQQRQMQFERAAEQMEKHQQDVAIRGQKAARSRLWAAQRRRNLLRRRRPGRILRPRRFRRMLRLRLQMGRRNSDLHSKPLGIVICPCYGS